VFASLKDTTVDQAASGHLPCCPLRDLAKRIVEQSLEGPGRRPPGQISDAADSTAQAKAKARRAGTFRATGWSYPGRRLPRLDRRASSLAYEPVPGGVERRQRIRQDGDATRESVRASSLRYAPARRPHALAWNHGTSILGNNAIDSDETGDGNLFGQRKGTGMLCLNPPDPDRSLPRSLQKTPRKPGHRRSGPSRTQRVETEQ
jgi:hypothetical protein